MPTAVAIQCVVVTTPNVPSISGRVVKVLGLILVMNSLLAIGTAWHRRWLVAWRRPAHRDRMYRAARAAARVGGQGGANVAREPLKVGLAGLGAVGLDVARRIEAGIPGLVLTAVSVRDTEKAQAQPAAGRQPSIAVVAAEALAETCDLVVECLPPAMFRTVATPVDRTRQAVHAAVGRPASGKLGFGGAGERDRRAHSGADRRA